MSILKDFEVLKSKDGKTIKFVSELDDGNFVETTYVDYPNKHIICFSSLVGCPLHCKFCISGNYGGYVRNLTKREILCQIERASRFLSDEKKPVLFSAMGEGEPSYNLNVILSVFKELSFPNYKYSISTVYMHPQMVEKLGEFGSRLKVQYSLHSANDHDRNILMKGTGSIWKDHVFIERLMKHGNPVEINYVPMHRVNDAVYDADNIIQWIEPHWKLKLNRFNKFIGSPFEETRNIQAFADYLSDRGVNVEIYETNGTDIGAACGQMSYYNSIFKQNEEAR